MKNAKTTLVAFLASAIFVMALGMVDAHAEPPHHLRDEALEGKQLWDRIIHLQGIQNITEAEQSELAEAEKRFVEIRTMMNIHGMATPRQMEENSDYWENYDDDVEGVSGASRDGVGVFVRNNCGSSQAIPTNGLDGGRGMNGQMTGHMPTQPIGI